MWSACLLSLLLTSAPAVAAGAAARSITPRLEPGPVYLAGYGPGRVATGIHDEVWARALVLEIDGRRLALVAVDLIGLFLTDVEAVRSLLPADSGIDDLVVASTHTHSGPDTLGLWGPTLFVGGRQPEYLRFVRQRIAQAISAAAAELRPARLLLGEGVVPGLIRDKRPPRVIDERLLVLAADDADTGAAIATLSCFSVHPEVLTRDSTQLSSDFPHYTRERIEARRGGVALHLSGSIGGLMTPGVEGLEGAVGPPGSIERMRQYGRRLGDEVLGRLESAEPLLADRFELRSKTVFVPLENGYYRLAMAMGVLDGRRLYSDGQVDERRLEPLLEGFPRHPLGEDLRTEVSLLTLGPLSLALIPGEIYPELTLGRIPLPLDPHRDHPRAEPEPGLLEMLPGRSRYVLGLANDEIGYILPRCQWDEDAPWTFGQRSKPYGEINSVGPMAGPIILAALAELVRDS